MFPTRHVIALAAALTCAAAQAQTTNITVTIGVLTDMSSLYSDITGPGSVVAAKLAVQDFGAAAKGIKVEVISGDHLNKPDAGTSIAGTWFDVAGVDAIIDVPNSGVALAINEIARRKNKAFFPLGAATSALTANQCSPTTIHWVYDTWELANETGKAVVKSGGDT
jgi:branched-chain amino acid transport system substrate-binding protein